MINKNAAYKPSSDIDDARQEASARVEVSMQYPCRIIHSFKNTNEYSWVHATSMDANSIIFTLIDFPGWILL